MNKKKAAFWVAGALAGAFAFSAGLWSLYPENRDTVTNLGREIGILDPLPPTEQLPLAFIRSNPDHKTGYLPAHAAQGCSADGKIVRLIYRMAITADERREDILNHPRINHNEQKYETFRRESLASLIQQSWAEEPRNFNNLIDAEASASLQRWLIDQAAMLYRTQGLKVAFEVNTETGVEIMEAPQAAPGACRPAP